MGRQQKDIPDEVLFNVVERLISGVSTTRIARELGTGITREQIYPMLQRAQRRGLLQLVKPRDMDLEARLAKKCNLRPQNVQVIRVRGPRALEHVADAAAEMLLSVINDLRTPGEPMHIASGAGRTSYLVSRNLGRLLSSQLVRAGSPTNPDIVFHALTGGWDPESPLDFASAQFSCFIEEERPFAGFIGLSAPPVVHPDLFEQVRNLPFVRTSFEKASEIELVYTSLGSASDDHCSFTRVVRTQSAVVQGELRDAGWIGDCQYQPYSSSGAIAGLKNGLQAFSVVNLDDLRRMSRHARKGVVLVAGPCGRCGESRAKALAPLVATLGVGSHLVIDIKTAEDLNALLSEWP